MKKILGIFVFLLFLVGCSLSNSPTSKVEELFNKYQTLDNDIRSQINDVLETETLTDSQRDRYQKLIEMQYRNLAYEVKNERIDGNTAIITTEIEVTDFKKAINETNSEYQKMTNYTVEDYNNTKLERLEKTKEKVTYTIDFEVKKDKNDNWKLASLDNETIKKLQGMF